MDSSIEISASMSSKGVWNTSAPLGPEATYPSVAVTTQRSASPNVIFGAAVSVSAVFVLVMMVLLILKVSRSKKFHVILWFMFRQSLQGGPVRGQESGGRGVRQGGPRSCVIQFAWFEPLASKSGMTKLRPNWIKFVLFSCNSYDIMKL